MRGGVFGWDYPPGVTGNEPSISGEYPCVECDGGIYDEDGVCPRCGHRDPDYEEDE